MPAPSRAPSLRARANETLDAICGGRVRLLQPRDGYRFALDALLLAHFAAEAPGSALQGPTLDLGTGCGVIALILARKFGATAVTALEIQPELFDLARRNVLKNRAERRVAVVLGDLRLAARQLPAGGFAQVICNPPYRPREAGRLNPREQKAIARHEVLCTLDDVAAAAAHALAHRGSLSLVYPSARLGTLLEVLRRRRLEPKRLRLVHPHAGQPANLVLVQAVKGGREQLDVEPPLVLHANGAGDFSAEVQRMVDEAR